MSGETAVAGGVVQSAFRRWLEVLLPIYTGALVVVWFRPEHTPDVFTRSMGLSPLPWLAWGAAGAMLGVLALWSLIVAFFLLYSPVYLLGKTPMLVGKGGWVDRRELRFYGACFLLLCVLAALAYWDVPAALVVFSTAAGCGPVFWRLLV
jgi:hypothetical protein